MLPRLAVAVAALVGFAAVHAAEAPTVAAYYAGGKPETLERHSVGRLTHLIYAFVPLCGPKPAKVPDPCAGRAPYTLAPPPAAELAALGRAKARHPRLRIIASIGGWGMPHYPSTIADPANARAFTVSAVALLAANRQLDGIDVDWEYPGGGDNERPLLTGVALAAERRAHRDFVLGLRRALDESGKRAGRHYLLTAAVAGYPRSVAAIDWPAVHGAFDRVFVMAYDFTPEKSFRRLGDFSGGGGLPGHHANLHASPATDGDGGDAMVANLAGAGVPKTKLVLGIGFYGREWTGARWAEGGFPAGGASGRFVGTPTWSELRRRHPKGWRRAYDARAGATWWHNRTTGGFVSLDDPRSIAAKGRWARTQGLAGLFAWELSQDDGTLTEAMSRAAGGRR